MVVMGTGKPVTAAARRAMAIRKIRQRRSRIALCIIIFVSVVVPICVTVLFIGTARAQGYAVLSLALLMVSLGFVALFQRPIPKSQSTWPDPPPERIRGW
jgi:hypothetical protein